MAEKDARNEKADAGTSGQKPGVPASGSTGRKTPVDVEVPKGHRPGQEKSPAVGGAEQVQEYKDAEEERGYFGETPDPTPNEVYALPHPSLEPRPAPEVDPDYEAEVAQHLRRLGSTHPHRRPN